MAVLAVEPWGTELTVDALEVGSAQAASQLRVLLAGIVFGPASVAIAAHNLSSLLYLGHGVVVGEGNGVAAWEAREACCTGLALLPCEVESAVAAASQVFTRPVCEVGLTVAAKAGVG